MESLEQTNNLENKEKYGKDVTLVVDLIRHPEKDNKTGNLTEKGKEDFVKKLNEEYADPENKFDTVKAYVSPFKRGQQAIEPLQQFLTENEIETKVRTNDKLLSRSNDYYLKKGHDILDEEILINDFFEKEFPGSDVKGEDFANDMDNIIQHLAKMAKRFLSESKVKIVLVGHRGIIEYLTKLIYLKNHPELQPEDVKIDQIGGLLDYMSGPKITIQSDTEGKQTAKLEFKDLNLDYEIRE